MICFRKAKNVQKQLFFAHTVRFFLINMKNWYSLIFFIYIRKCQILWKKTAVFACFSSFENKTLLNTCKTQYFQQNQQFGSQLQKQLKSINHTAKCEKTHENCRYLYKNDKFKTISIFHIYKKKSNSLRKKLCFCTFLAFRKQNRLKNVCIAVQNQQNCKYISKHYWKANKTR